MLARLLQVRVSALTRALVGRYFHTNAGLATQTNTYEDVTHPEIFQKVDVKEIISRFRELGPFPADSSVLNPQHYYQNQSVLDWMFKHKSHPVTLRQLAGFGRRLTREKILTSANFVRIELPTRLAMRLEDLQRLPFGVTNNFHLVQVYESYCHAFNLFRKYPKITSLEENDAFNEFLSRLLDEHLMVLPHLVMGALECSISQVLPPQALDQFISSLLRLRISRRVIIEEHLSLSKSFKASPHEEKPADYIGDLFYQCDAVDTLQKVALLIKDSLAAQYPDISMPELKIDTTTANKLVKFPFLISHLHFIFGEILRNSFDATLQHHIAQCQANGTDPKTISPPPISINIVELKTDILFRFSDRGGGIEDDILSNIWSFGKPPDISSESLLNFHLLPGLELSSESVLQTSQLAVPSSPTHFSRKEAPLTKDVLVSTSLQDNMSARGGSLNTLTTRPYEFKLGLGLAMCKVYVDYWNGEIKMHSMKGYGSDTFLKLTRLGEVGTKAQMDRA
ncbi:hypothetical protein BABINDRAFT_9922 [Babjeviella inositovora NRRL Y-12698]|uniref:Protein-serine/threonine kinase n=1 Tax=Babjeviella inositovora NRRL Y-12698 TaxID=984486 RepID=A0A1E3QIP9_9ASCO|nr:uncharacterized protein BABINDRAFT_9922 [Babjeviella inositovora NRRL Y-12698]ODQ77576.1 hypothetical protein BABINDRAFT_9922 [Babjeviella inositovora NRRL Y-12698]